MIRKIIANIFVSFTLFPMIFIFQDWRNIISGNYQYYDSHYNTLSEYVYVLLHEQGYPILSIFSLLCVFLPFQLTKDYFFRKKRKIIFINKVILLTIIMGVILLIFCLLYDMWKVPWWNNYVYLVFVLGFGLIFTPILYFTIDKYVEKD
ncbi:hypothetical protein CMU93_00930 [Elizabethkingia anophelis]|nr:hypothetical protein [Elizabethkingia anophelis]